MGRHRNKPPGGAPPEHRAGPTESAGDHSSQRAKNVEPIRKDVQLFLYDAARKLLHNVALHAGRDTARLEIRRLSPRRVRLTISDEGAGFDPAALEEIPSNNFGLFSIREEAQLLGGTMEVDSAPGRGTRVSITVPA